MSKCIIAIDGPSGSGKSSVAKLVAKQIGFVYVKTGDMFRAITYKMIQEGIVPENEEDTEKVLNSINLDFQFKNNEQLSVLDGDDITSFLNSMEVSKYVSQFSSNVLVRQKVLEFERKVAQDNSIVMEGRDIGTTVFPNADVKIYLDASAEERANRRYKQNMEKGIECSLEEIKQNIMARDENDKNKKVGALVLADDAIIVQNSNRDITSTVDEILQIINEKIGDKI